MHHGTLLGLVCSLLAAEDGFGRVLGPSLARFGCSRGPFRGCIGLRQTDFDHHNCPSELRSLMFLVVVVDVAAAVVVVAVAVVVSLLPCNCSSMRLGGMRGAIG